MQERGLGGRDITSSIGFVVSTDQGQREKRGGWSWSLLVPLSPSVSKS